MVTALLLAPGVRSFSEQLAQRRHVEHLLGQELLQLAVLLLPGLQPLRVRDLEPAVLRSPRVERGVADPVLAADLRHRQRAIANLGG